MGDYDIAQMKFFRDTRHFADIWNGLAFNGRQVVNYSATSNRASCFNHYCVGYDIHNSASYTVSTGV